MKQVLLAAGLMTGLLLTSCSNKKTETPAASNSTAAAAGEERNKKTVLANLEALNNHDANMMLKDAAPGAVEYGDGSMPPVTNLDSIKAGLSMFLNAFPDLKMQNPMLFVSGSRVAVVADYKGTFKNDFQGMKATNKTIQYKDCDIFTFTEDGKIAEHRAIMPFSSILMMAGAKIP